MKDRVFIRSVRGEKSHSYLHSVVSFDDYLWIAIVYLEFVFFPDRYDSEAIRRDRSSRDLQIGKRLAELSKRCSSTSPVYRHGLFEFQLCRTSSYDESH